MGGQQYNFDLKFQAGKFTVEIDTAANYGYFEHDERGDECGGGLWLAPITPDRFFDFEQGKYQAAIASGAKVMLTDYDGVVCLPKAVAAGLREHGFFVEDDE
jgi:hypothetical protein